MFIHKNKKIVGIMWHPERNIKISKLDKMIFKKIYAINYSGIG